MIQGDFPACLFSFNFTPTLESSKMSSFAMIGEIVQSKQNKLEKSQDQCHHKL